MMSLVRKYMSTANRFRSNFIPSLTSLGIHRGSLKTSFTSGKDFKVKGSFRSITTECRECIDSMNDSTERVKHCVLFWQTLGINVEGNTLFLAPFPSSVSLKLLCLSVGLHPNIRSMHFSSCAAMYGANTMSVIFKCSWYSSIQHLNHNCTIENSFGGRRDSRHRICSLEVILRWGVA